MLQRRRRVNVVGCGDVGCGNVADVDVGKWHVDVEDGKVGGGSGDEKAGMGDVFLFYINAHGHARRTVCSSSNRLKLKLKFKLECCIMEPGALTLSLPMPNIAISIYPQLELLNTLSTSVA
jgi:hypothetical protein